MKKKHYSVILLSLLLLIASCEKKEHLVFGSKMEQLSAEREDGSKVVLVHDEQWLVWESGDATMLYMPERSESVECDLSSGEGTREGVFSSLTPASGDITAFAVYPASCAQGQPVDYSGSPGSGTLPITLPASRDYRLRSDPYGDSSFAIGSMPMVAYIPEGVNNADSVRFHVLGGIMRLQFWNSERNNDRRYTIESLELSDISSVVGDGSNKKLSGDFTVKRIKRENPYIQSASAAGSDNTMTYNFSTLSEEQRTVGGANVTDESGTHPEGRLWTIYIPLLAMGTSADQVTNYHLNMRLKLKDVATGKYLYYIKGIHVDIHRCNITMMRAVDLRTEYLTENANDGRNSYEVTGLVGSGTKARPFQIYTAEELQILRDAINSGGTVNGQTIRGIVGNSPATNTTYFKIMRSDIFLVSETQWTDELDDDQRASKKYVVWNYGFRNFKGYMTYSSASGSQGSLSNTSGVPLFESIATDGMVDRIQIRGNTDNYASAETFSPFCHTNRGYIIDCHNKASVTASLNANLAGLCVNNYGTIRGGANEAPLSTSNHVCGIAYNNFGTITGNFSLSQAIPEGSEIAGIAFHNYNLLQYCQVEIDVDPNSTGNWGVVAFYNHRDTTVAGTAYSNAVIDHCISSGSLVLTTTGSVGGICNINDGIVKNSDNRVTLRGATNAIGGIVAVMRRGELYNCSVEGTHTIDGTGGVHNGIVALYAGGLVGHLKGGALRNSYNQCTVDGATNSGGLVGNIDEGAIIENCWCATGRNLIGANFAEGHMGFYCYSAAAGDFNRRPSLTPKGSNTLQVNYTDNSHTVINAITVSQMQEGQDNDEIHEPGTEGYTGYVGRNLAVPLNDWVTNANSNPGSYGGHSDYRSWTTTTPIPRLD